MYEETLPSWIKRDRDSTKRKEVFGPSKFHWQEVGWEKFSVVNMDSFIKKKKKREKGRMTQGSDPKLQNMELRARENYSQDLRLNQGMFNICSAGFQNYNGPVTPLCPPFSLFLNSYPITPVSPWCVGCMEGHISCCFSFTGGEELYSRGCT